jgi:hypothetical protein
MEIMTADPTPKTGPIPEAASCLRWTFVRKGHVLTCEIRAAGAQSYDVCVVPHWDVDSSVIELYDRPTAALRRHAELVWYLREAGWVRISEAASEHLAVA